jgi:hypothetical protein
MTRDDLWFLHTPSSRYIYLRVHEDAIQGEQQRGTLQRAHTLLLK